MADNATLPAPQPLPIAPASQGEAPAAQPSEIAPTPTNEAIAAPTASATLPPPAPLPLPAPEPIPSAGEAPGTTDLPAPVNPAEQPISDKTTGILDRLKQHVESDVHGLGQMVAGPGTFLGPETKGATVHEMMNESLADTWKKEKIAAHNFLDSSLIVPANAFDPAEVAAHPHEAAAARGVSNVVQQLTTPISFGLIVATAGADGIPALLESTLGKTAALAPYAATAAKVSKTALQGLGVFFTADQIAKVMESVPEVAQAVMTGQTDKAIELATSAFVNGVVAGAAGRETYKSIHGAAPIAAETNAMKHGDYADLVHERQKTLQIAGGQKDQIANLGREAAPNVKDREWATEYVESGKNRDVMRERQAQTKTGPTPTEQIADAQSAGKPIEEAAPAIAYREDANGTRWAKTPDSPAEVSIPKNLEGEAADKYAQEKLDLQKQFAASRAPQPTTATETSAEAQAPVDRNSPAAQHALEIMAALKDAEEAAKAHVITPEERAKMTEQQDPDRKLTPKHEKAIDTTIAAMNALKKEAQSRVLLPAGQVRENYVPHEWGFDDGSDPTKARLFDTYHEGQQAGNVSPNKDYFALTSDYIGNMWNRIANHDTVQALKTGRTNEGAPLAVPGGFIEGQRVSAEGPQSRILDHFEIRRLTDKGQLAGLIKSGRVIQDADKNLILKADDYVKAKNLYEVRPIGPAPIPPNVLAEMKANGSLDALEQKGLVYKDAQGNYINKENLYARVPVYLHPDIAEHFNEVVKPKTEAPTTVIGKAGKLYDDVTGNMKSLLLSWSPFHRVTESMRMMESLGIVPGGNLALQTNLGLAPKIDYFHLEPWQEAAIRDGIVTADPRGRSSSNVEEGLSAGSEKNWGAKTYRLFDKGLEKLGVPEEIRNKVNLQKILTDDVFGPQGMITQAKFELYKNRKPEIATQIAKDHPNWSPQEVDKHAGQIASRFANDKFGGLNNVLLGRTLQDQKVLRRVLLAPDFLESTGRSILDLANPYGSSMAANLIRFNIAHLLTAAGINYALHHDPDDNSVKGAVEASHILDHPYGVVAPDDKSVYGLRTTMTDFLHMVNAPRDFVYNRVSPLLRSADEIAEQRNQYGRKESLFEAAKSLPKAALPIQVQTPLGLGPNTTTEPTVTDQILRSLGIQAKPNRTNAEQLAIKKVSEKLQGTEARTGPALIRQQLKYNAEDNLRAALKNPDPEARKAGIEKAQHTLDSLVQQKQVTPEEAKNIKMDAKVSRLTSDFKHMSYDDALDVWGATTDQEKKDLGIALKSKYLDWSKKMTRDGFTVRNLPPEQQDTLKRFQVALAQANEVASRPEPLPKPAKDEKVEKASAPAMTALPPPEPIPATGEELPPPVPIAPAAPAVYKIGDYKPLIDASAQKYGVAPDLIEAMIHQESAGNPNAVSKRGAQGLMQLLPSTAKEYGVTNINDPEQNIEAGVHYMADLLKQYNGDEAKALAAYNAGPQAVLKYGGVPPFRETREYVDKIQGRNQQ